jgi:hypothetical protein
MSVFQLVLDNLNTYVEVVHHSGYSPSLMQCEYIIWFRWMVIQQLGLLIVVGLRLSNITRRTAEWSYDSFDSTPVLLMSSTLIQHNTAQSRVSLSFPLFSARLTLYQELLMYLENILRTTLSRFHASAESLKSIFRVTSILYKRYNAQNQNGDNEKSANEITMAILEIFSDVLRGKARIPPSTLTSIAEVSIWFQPHTMSSHSVIT